MIELMPQTEADKRGVDMREVQCISPYLNPAHVLAPPRPWLEALLSGEYTWHFFRLRYKNLLRARYQAEPERFADLLRDSEGARRLVLTCHCLTPHCHREVAREFLERLRERNAEALAHSPAAYMPSPWPIATRSNFARPQFTRPSFTQPDKALPQVSRPAFALQMLTSGELPPPQPEWKREQAPRFDRVANG